MRVDFPNFRNSCPQTIDQGESGVGTILIPPQVHSRGIFSRWFDFWHFQSRVIALPWRKTAFLVAPFHMKIPGISSRMSEFHNISSITHPNWFRSPCSCLLDVMWRVRVFFNQKTFHLPSVVSKHTPQKMKVVHFGLDFRPLDVLNRF